MNIPEKWCVKTEEATREIVERFLHANGYIAKLHNEDYYCHFPFIGKSGSCYYNIQQGYTEITFEQFEKYILNKKTSVEDYNYLIPILKKLNIQ